MIDETLVNILEDVTSDVYPLVLPQKPPYPSIVYRRMKVETPLAHDGYGEPMASFEIWCYAATYTSARETAEDAVTLLAGYTEWDIGGSRSLIIFVDNLYDRVFRLDDKFLYASVLNIRVWYAEGDYES